jgi:uncharacterized DUF497 family protein
MIVTWDEPKRLANLDKHDLDFALVDEAFFDCSFVMPATNGRFKAVGLLSGATVVVIVFALLGQEAVSVISLRQASRLEREFFRGQAQV